jgi:uncharacterized membrane protein YsdA (DUF1294 family)
VLLHPSPALLLGWVELLTLAGFVAMGVDKVLAVTRSTRVSERTLWTAGLLGGFLGIAAGGLLFNHKTSKERFWGPVAAAALLWAALFVLDAAGA